MVAISGCALDHVPPAAGYDKVVVALTQTCLLPEIKDERGMGLTITVDAVKQPVGNLYVMVAVPVAIPIITPEGININAVSGALLAHVPPGVALVSVVVSP